jgi:hypothetical protein
MLLQEDYKMPTIKIVPFPGVPGATGPRGAQGIQGETGLTGPIGPAGDATAYTPNESSNWNTTPTTIAEALDELASRVKALEGGI